MSNRLIRPRSFYNIAPFYNILSDSIRRINQQNINTGKIPAIKTSPAIFPLYPSLRTYLPEMPKRFVSPLPNYNAANLAIVLGDKFLDWISQFNSPRKSPQTPALEDKPIKKPETIPPQASTVTVRSPKTTGGELVPTPKGSSLAFAIASTNQPTQAIRGLLSTQKTRNLIIPQTLVLYTSLPIVPQLNMSHGKTLSVWNLDFNPQGPMDSPIKKPMMDAPEVSELAVVARPAMSAETQLEVTQSHQKTLDPQQLLEYKLEIFFQTLGTTLLKNPELILREPELLGLTKHLFYPEISSLAYAITSINQQNQVIIGILPVVNTRNSIFPQTLLFLSNSPIDFQLMHIPDGNMFIQFDENFNLIETSPQNAATTDRRFELLEDDSPELVESAPTKFDLPTTEPMTSIPQTQRLIPIQLLEQKLKIISNAISQKGYNPEHQRMIEYLIADLDSRESDFSSSDREKYDQILQEARQLMEKATARHEEARQASIDGAVEEVAPTDELVAPTDELVAPTDELVAPTDELVAPTDELVAPIDEGVAPIDEGVAPIDELVASDGASDTEDEVVESDTEDEVVEDVVVVVVTPSVEEVNKIPQDVKNLILGAMDAAIKSSTYNYVGKKDKNDALQAIKVAFNSAENMEDQKTQLDNFIKKAMEHRTPSIFSRNESTPAQSTTASMLAFKKALGDKFDTVIALLSPPAASDEENRTEPNLTAR